MKKFFTLSLLGIFFFPLTAQAQEKTDSMSNALGRLKGIYLSPEKQKETENDFQINLKKRIPQEPEQRKFTIPLRPEIEQRDVMTDDFAKPEPFEPEPNLLNDGEQEQEALGKRLREIQEQIQKLHQEEQELHEGMKRHEEERREAVKRQWDEQGESWKTEQMKAWEQKMEALQGEQKDKQEEWNQEQEVIRQEEESFRQQMEAKSKERREKEEAWRRDWENRMQQLRQEEEQMRREWDMKREEFFREEGGGNGEQNFQEPREENNYEWGKEGERQEFEPYDSESFVPESPRAYPVPLYREQERKENSVIPSDTLEPKEGRFQFFPPATSLQQSLIRPESGLEKVKARNAKAQKKLFKLRDIGHWWE